MPDRFQKPVSIPSLERPRFQPGEPLGAAWFERQLDKLREAAYAAGLRDGDALRTKEVPPDGTLSSDCRERFADELQRAKLDAMKELAYGASHEVNNPLANIALRAQSLLKREDDPDKRKMLEAMHRAAMRAHEMISDLMLFARPPEPQCEVVDLASVARRVVEELKSLARERGIQVSTAQQEEVYAWADPTQVAVALRALVDNALEALEPEGEIAISVQSIEERATFLVQDNGPGIPTEILPHIFDPFFSGREAGRGLGFGLSKCWRIATGHGGGVELRSKLGEGVRATLWFPAAEESTAIESCVDRDIEE